MKIRFLNSVASAVGSFAPGAVEDLEAEIAQGFVRAGHAEPVEKEERAVSVPVVEKATRRR